MNSTDCPSPEDSSEGPLEVALIGDLTEHESDCYDKMLGVAPGSACTLYINSPGGSAYTAISLMTLIRLRGLEVTGRRDGRVFVGRVVAAGGLLAPPGHALQHPAVPSDEMAE